MKKLLSVFLVIVLLLTCTACNGKKNNTMKNEFSLGTLNGQSYVNNFLGFGCLLPNNWTIMEQDRLHQIPTADGDICAMYATASAHEIVRIDFRPMDEAQLSSLDLELFCKDYLSGLNPFMENASNPIQETYAPASVTVRRESLIGFRRTVTQGDSTVYFAAFAVKCDGYVARITINTVVSERVEQIMASFYKL